MFHPSGSVRLRARGRLPEPRRGGAFGDGYRPDRAGAAQPSVPSARLVPSVIGGLALPAGLLLYGLSLTDWFKTSQQASRLAPPFVTLGEQMVDGGRQLLQ